MKKLFSILIFLSFFIVISNAEVIKVEIESREDVLEGNEFGDYGAYELIKGKIYFRFDPANSSNGRWRKAPTDWCPVAPLVNHPP